MIPYTNDNNATTAIVGAKDAQYELEYFPLLFNSTGTRAILAYSGLKYKETNISPADWPNYKSNTPYECLPVLKVTKDSQEVKVSEVLAIDFFLGRQAGLMGKNDFEDAVILAHHNNAQCLFFGSTMVGFFWPTAALDDKQKKEGLEKLKTQIASWARQVEGHLAANEKHGVLVGDKVTIADIKVVATVTAIASVLGAHHVEPIVNKEKTPLLIKLEQKLLENESYKAWVESDAFQALKAGSKGFATKFHPEFYTEE
ncbi:hypothetical protein BGW42_006473 [Actinomortierella wolfii]|nr:hypothetical protein BGW42_006473 [Actinomortierella wolfii]KAG0229445.1 hypothetical protein BGW41_003022 [Actinomortierella wolfii]